jgi:7,8-dihydropterin-6-yl-methyl-4-(beta-D-ribofuranosyl)aminobenzene 5'-phosphate synthase
MRLLGHLKMKLKITYDNEALAGFKRNWGFSCLVGEHVLFDTGADCSTLFSNMQELKIDLKEIDTVVLSHAHGDHTGGIEIVGLLGDVQVFVPRSFFTPLKRELSRFKNVETMEVSDMTEVAEGIASTGEIARVEQSLIVQTHKGLVIVTGCSHPGLDRIMNQAKELGTIYGVVGGFHEFDKLELLRGLEMIVPCHCTKHKKRILADYPNTSKQCAAGCVFDI